MVGLAALTVEEREALKSSLMSIMQAEASKISSVEDARRAQNVALGRGSYEPIFSVDITMDEVQNAFVYTIKGACELAHRMMVTNSTLHTSIVGLGYHEKTRARCVHVRDAREHVACVPFGLAWMREL